MEAIQSPRPMNWFEIWGAVLVHPNKLTYDRIVDNPKVTLRWGIFWTAFTACVWWLIGPTSLTIQGIFLNTFGLRVRVYLYIIGTIWAVILGIVGLLLTSALAHGLASRFQGQGSFRRLVSSWGVMQVPFFILAGMVSYAPSIIIHSREFAFSTSGVILQVGALVIAAGILLYYAYSSLVAFNAVEKFTFNRGFVLLLITCGIVAAIVAGLATGLQLLVMNLLRYF